ncbi:MAG: Na+/H+ antiporter NhaA [Planctomycetota bacterium]|jgi:NhaA family Na+:H+ antiporter
MAHGHANGWSAKVREYSLPLIVGVFAGLAAANIDSHWYHELIDYPLGGLSVFGHVLTPHFLINDIFMVFFFGVAAKEITDAVMPGGALNPPSRAINPLLGTIGGVVGPAGVFLGLTYLLYAGEPELAAVANGWGIPTATDIALAWLCARLVFGARHPAVNFLLLLAVADDAIGLAIIAIFYPDPAMPVAPINLLWTALGMGAALGLRLANVRSWGPYILIAGGLSWYGLLSAHLHPALALVFVVPFLPSPREGPSTLEAFEHHVKPTVDWGLFFFAFANAGVEFANMGPITWIILAALIVGKPLGVTLLSGLGTKLGFPLPVGMNLKTLATAGLIAGLGLTVALFVAGQAYVDEGMRAEAKMGALFSGVVFVLAIVVGRVLRIRRWTTDGGPEAAPAEPVPEPAPEPRPDRPSETVGA